MFGLVDGASRNLPSRGTAGHIVAIAASALLGACAHNPGDMPALQWQAVSATDASAAAYSSTETSPATGCGDACYVYRGGRDPSTGRAYTQL
jgi:hypothetical protein